MNDNLELGIDDIDNGSSNGNIEDITNDDLLLDGATSSESNVEAQKEQEQEQETSSKGEGNSLDLSNGDTVELDGVSYSVNDKNELIDADGKVFKTSEELAAIVEANKDFDENDTLLISDIQKKIGIEVVDETGNPVEFDNSPEGIAAYVDAVVSVREDEIEETTINSLLEEYPVIEQVINHIKVHGDLSGFSEIVDRSSIVIDKDNESQQIAIIKEEWKSQGKIGSPDGYIEYLKTAGTLYDTAVECNTTLAAINEAQVEASREAAAEKEAAEDAEYAAYQELINSVIDSGEILGYNIPDRITVKRGGRQQVLGKGDFKNYISRPVDKEGNTAYMLDRNSEDTKLRVEEDLIRAYLKFTGSDYSSLVSMAVNKEKVKTLRLNSSANVAKKTVKLNNVSSSKKVDNSKLDLG